MPKLTTHSFSDLDKGRIEHIDFEFKISFTEKSIEGLARYRLNQAVSGTLMLDTRSIDVKDAWVAGTPIEASLDAEDPVLGQRLTLELPPETSEFTISFVTSPNASALQWLPPQQTAGGQHPFLFTQSQAIQARSVFPCQDTPSVRFTFTAKVKIKSGLMAVMAAAPTGFESGPQVDTYQFEMPQPIPSDLFAMAAGNLGFRDIGPRCRIYAEPEKLEEAAWEFESTEASISTAENLLGPYEWDRYDLLMMPPSFPYGGMENPRLNFITPTLLVGDRSLVDVIYHELAHAWTGNLVTNATWTDFWLNEGWTVYAERRISELIVGEDYVQLKAAIDREDMFVLIDRFKDDPDLTKLQFDINERDLNYSLSEIQYTKGCEFLLRLEEAVGRSRFDDFVQTYIQTFRFKSITTANFLELLQQELPDAIEKVNINEWLYEPGFPTSAPPIDSRLMDEVEHTLAAYKTGGIPLSGEMTDWTTHQIHYFLLKLKKDIPIDDLLYLEDLFGLQNSKNGFLLAPYYDIAIRSGYREIYARAEKFTREVGRIILSGRVYRALAETEWSKGLVRPLLDDCRPYYHPLTVKYIERILKQAGV